MRRRFGDVYARSTFVNTHTLGSTLILRDWLMLLMA